MLQPAVLLLDEPLGALDAKLRRQLQVELKQLQNQVGITFVYVTHDQEEALTMSDRIAVINRGRIEQAASPQDLYEEPANAFVADFLGVSNLMDATVAGPSAGGSGAEVRLSDNFSVEVRSGDVAHRGPAKVVIRPERIGVEPAGTPGPNRVPGMLTNIVYLGSGLQLAIQLASGHARDGAGAEQRRRDDIGVVARHGRGLPPAADRAAAPGPSGTAPATGERRVSGPPPSRAAGVALRYSLRLPPRRSPSPPRSAWPDAAARPAASARQRGTSVACDYRAPQR